MTESPRTNARLSEASSRSRTRIVAAIVPVGAGPAVIGAATSTSRPPRWIAIADVIVAWALPIVLSADASAIRRISSSLGSRVPNSRSVGGATQRTASDESIHRIERNW